MSVPNSQSLGISAIAVHEPPWVLENDWFGGSIPRKFAQHTGIQSRRIAQEDEVTLAVRATDRLQRDLQLDLHDCAAVIFVSPSFLPISVARRHLDEQQTHHERLLPAAHQFVQRLKIPACRVYALNWFCSGYAKALSIAQRQTVPPRSLDRNQFVLVVTSSRISRITDYGCSQTAPLFGDIATATVLSPVDSDKYPPRFALLFAQADVRPTQGVYFDFHWREKVLVPAADGGREYAPHRLVYSLDGMGIADAAPRAMSAAVANALRATQTRPDQVRFVVPHQAGTGIVRFAAMKLGDLGIRAEVINGLTRRVGNISSCSIPYALHQSWEQLEGLIACPTAAVGQPGRAEVSQGCILLRSIGQGRQLVHAA